jgi:hypothetical protein
VRICKTVDRTISLNFPLSSLAIDISSNFTLDIYVWGFHTLFSQFPFSADQVGNRRISFSNCQLDTSGKGMLQARGYFRQGDTSGKGILQARARRVADHRCMYMSIALILAGLYPTPVRVHPRHPDGPPVARFCTCISGNPCLLSGVRPSEWLGYRQKEVLRKSTK